MAHVLTKVGTVRRSRNVIWLVFAERRTLRASFSCWGLRGPPPGP